MSIHRYQCNTLLQKKEVLRFASREGINNRLHDVSRGFSECNSRLVARTLQRGIHFDHGCGALMTIRIIIITYQYYVKRLSLVSKILIIILH